MVPHRGFRKQQQSRTKLLIRRHSRNQKKGVRGKILEKFTIYAKYTCMNEAADPNILIVAILVTIAFIFILIILIRWLFRINEIVALLKDIRNTICRQNSDTSLQLCEGCSRNFDKNQLKIIASGQLLCPECVKNLKNRK